MKRVPAKTARSSWSPRCTQHPAYIVQFGDSVYNDEESSVLGAVMKERVKAVISTKPAFKKWIEETMAGVLKDVRSKDLMW